MPGRTRSLRWIGLLALAGAGAAALLILRRPDTPRDSAAAAAPAVAPPVTVAISWEEARPILEAFSDRLPIDLNAIAPADRPAAWPVWLARHDAAVRARLDRGDEDSIVNFWLYGTSFTTRPRATAADLAKHGGRAAAEDLLVGRLNDLVAALATTGGDERLRFARDVLTRRGFDPAAPGGQDFARRELIALRARAVSDNARYRQAARDAGAIANGDDRQAAFATAYRDRGLSADTSLPIDFAVDESLTAARSQSRLAAGSIRRVAIVGPGLDFTDKADGYDFYPPQTIQPFAVIDSLIRHGLAAADQLQVVTFDLSPRVNRHLDAARQRAREGTPYVLQLPFTRDDPAHEWVPAFARYWERCGDRIGDTVPPLPAPAGAVDVRVRAVGVRPGIVSAISPHDLNIVVERPGPASEPFDLILATNVLVYYDAFEQALALANVAAMLRPGGVFVTNYAVWPRAPLDRSPGFTTTTYWDRQRNFDTLFWYWRQ
jgi:SAM-dependent methyltransferase